MSTGAPSRSALDMLHWIGDDYRDNDERGLWEYLCQKAECYPQQYIPPLHKPVGRPRVHKQVGAKLDIRNDEQGQPIPHCLWLFDGSDSGSKTDLSGKTAGDAFSEALLTARYRSSFIVFREGGRIELRIIATQLAGRLIELGFTVDVLMGGSRLKALIIKKGKHRWYLCCWESLSGQSARDLPSYQSLYGGKITRTVNPAAIVYRAATGIQSWLIEWFGTGLSLTVSNSGLRAAARLLPPETCKFKPLPLMVSMCRNGGAFRGGLQRGSRYRGPSWLIDLNRAYTAALERPLPWRYVFDKCEKNGIERDGIYVCEVSTRREMVTCYLSRWEAGEVKTGWRTITPADRLYCCLTYREMLGLRRLHVTVEPGYGFVYTRTLSLAGFVGRIREALLRYGPRSPIGKLTKILGNSIYGKLASPPDRRDLRIAQGKPGKEWHVFVGEDGWPIEDLWERTRCIYQWSQHVDVAAEITGRVRGVMYETQADIEANGGRVVGMQTDSLVLTIDPAGVVNLDSERVGSWRLADADADGVVAGTNCWTIGHKTVCPDNPKPTREDIIALYHEYPIEIQAYKSGAPRPGAPLAITVIRRITPPGQASPSVAAD